MPRREGHSEAGLAGVECDACNLVCAHKQQTRSDDDILRAETRKDVQPGRCRSPKSKKKLDSKYGKGKWRCTWRHLIWQAQHCEHRGIDDRRRSEINAFAARWETMYTSPLDSPSRIVKRLRQRHRTPLRGRWVPLLYSEDQMDAYNRIPNALRHRRVAVVGLRMLKRRRSRRY